MPDQALICAYGFDGAGGVRELDAGGVRGWKPGEGWIWLHLDRTKAEAWLRNESGLDRLTVEALLEVETRPRSVGFASGMLVILRGVNLNPESDPEDMISIRLWVEQDRIISLRARRLMAVQDLRDAMAHGEVPETPGALLVAITGSMTDRMAPVLDDLNDAVDELEESVLDSPSYELRARLGQFRRQAIGLRRFLAPQREVLARLQTDSGTLLAEVDRNRLRETTDRLTRYLEELDATRERAAVTQEELAGRMSDQMNRIMYVLSVVSGIFLPLGLLTGLLGINVGGMPGVDNDHAFAIVCAVLVALFVAAVWIFRRLRLL
ncbi:MAG: zinc transporter ZntB [Planctomycetes bacterium]|nr:zinc transporter ZntB [Planctomycetota bacterium]MCB9904897.1 zinc transporter ZntB [Planctomycetota bacterium]